MINLTPTFLRTKNTKWRLHHVDHVDDVDYHHGSLWLQLSPHSLDDK
jgi:hypothetical protein